MSSSPSGGAEAPGCKPINELPGLKHRSGPANPAAEKKVVEDDTVERQVNSFNVFMQKQMQGRLALPQKVRFAKQADGQQVRVKQVECGKMHSLVLTENGEMYGFGDNSHG